MEVTLYDGHGHPIAYIADDEESIYLWTGHAVTYIVDEKLYGWNGHHLGWFVNGVLFDLHGYRVGSVREKCPYAVFAQSAKFAKFVKFAKFARFAPYGRPGLSGGYGSQSLEDFLKSGAVGPT